MQRTFGKLSLASNGHAGEWSLSCEPQVAMVLKRVFEGQAKHQFGTYQFENCPRVCRELEWFESRYPLAMSAGDRAALAGLSRAHQDHILRLDQIVDPSYKPREFSLAVPAREYQRRGAELYLANQQLLLADEVGLGKSCTAVCSFLDTRTLPAVVVCLAHLPRQWKREIEKFAPALNCHIIKKGTPYELPKFFGRQPDVLIVTYHKLRGWADILAKYAKSIVWDEAQELRRTGSDRYAAAEHLSCIPFRLGMSATPMYNYGGEMFNVLNILAPGQLGTQAEFNREWCEGYVNKLRLRDPDAFGAYLREQCLMLRRTRHDVNRELPPVSLITHEVDSDPEALKAVEGNAGELARLILSGARQERGAAMRAAEEFSMLLRQATGISKSPYVASFVELLIESGEPVVLYGWHRAVYDVWKEKLAKYSPAFYTGTESAAQKESAVRRFVSGETNLMILSLRSGAGLDGLQHRCRTVVFGEFDWSWGVHVQNIGRVHRDGQPDPVAAYFLRSDSGADPFMCDALGLKRRQLEGVIVPGEGELLKELGTAQHNVAEMARRYLEG